MPRKRKSEDIEHEIWQDETEMFEQFCDEEDAEMTELYLLQNYMDVMDYEKQTRKPETKQEKNIRRGTIN